MIRKIINGLIILIVGLFLYKLFGGDIAALIAGVFDLIIKIGDVGSDTLLAAWNKITA